MRCLKCGNQVFESTTAEAIELKNGGLLVVRHIPCHKCETCAEILYTGDVADQLDTLTAEAEALAQEIAVVNYVKTA